LAAVSQFSGNARQSNQNDVAVTHLMSNVNVAQQSPTPPQVCDNDTPQEGRMQKPGSGAYALEKVVLQTVRKEKSGTGNDQRMKAEK